MLNMIKVNVWPPVFQVCLQTTMYTYSVPGPSRPYSSTYTKFSLILLFLKCQLQFLFKKAKIDMIKQSGPLAQSSCRSIECCRSIKLDLSSTRIFYLRMRYMLISENMPPN